MTTQEKATIMEHVWEVLFLISLFGGGFLVLIAGG